MPTAITTVPVTIHPEAQAHAERLGLREAMERMIEQMKSMVPELRQITVTLERSPYDPTMEPQIYVREVEMPHARPCGDLSLLDAYTSWLITTFPPDVTMQFVHFICPEPDDGR